MFSNKDNVFVKYCKEKISSTIILMLVVLFIYTATPYTLYSMYPEIMSIFSAAVIIGFIAISINSLLYHYSIKDIRKSFTWKDIVALVLSILVVLCIVTYLFN